MAKRRKRRKKKGTSKFENKVAAWLNENDIEYEREKEFSTLVSENGFPLRFDFFIEELGTLIEVQGKQHYEMVPYFHKSMSDFRRQLDRDRMKEEYAEDNDLALILISYLNENNIADILENTILPQL